MSYTVGETSKKTGISPHTLRYYHREGLLPFVRRTKGGARDFREQDFPLLLTIVDLKKTGLTVKDIKKYIELYLEGDNTIALQYKIFEEQRKSLEDKLENTKRFMEDLCRKKAS